MPESKFDRMKRKPLVVHVHELPEACKKCLKQFADVAEREGMQRPFGNDYMIPYQCTYIKCPHKGSRNYGKVNFKYHWQIVAEKNPVPEVVKEWQHAEAIRLGKT